MQISIANIIRGTLIGNTMSVLTRYISRVANGGGIVEAPQCVETALNSQPLLQQASLLVVPSGYKGGTLYSEIPTNGNGDLTWTRGSDAFRTNASGLIQRVPWNLVQYSEDFSNAVWTKTRCSTIANSTTAPNGTTTADTLVEDTTATSTHPVSQAATLTAAAQTFSIYAKAANRNWIQLNLLSTANASAYFNLSNGTVGTVGSAATASIENIGDGWYRCIITITTAAGSNTLGIYPASADATTSFTGNGTASIYIWGAQLVEGTTAQTYLPTTDRLNFPRLDYTYGSCPAVLLEPQRTNLCLYSEQFDNASWVKPLGWTVTANATTSPDGTSNADLITPTNFNNLSQACVVTTSTNYAVSIYVKRNTTNFTWVNLVFSGGTLVDYGYIINWSTLSISLIPARTAAVSPTFESVGNGWYRISFVCASGNNTSASLRIVPDSQSGTNSIYLYGAQLELGAYATTYIPTTSATATRVADSFSRSNIYTNGLITSSGGTWFVELRNNIGYQRDANNGMWLGDSTSPNSGNQIMIRNGTTSGLARLSIIKYISGASTFLYSTTTDTVKIAINWNGSTADVFVNGIKQVSATAFTTTLMENLLGVGSSVPFFIQQMALYTEPLTDTKLIELTTL